jgi:tetratricopeptide (TPR) repeat protein
MISDQIAPVEWDRQRQLYRMTQPSSRDFGDEAFVDFESAVHLARGYYCKAIEVFISPDTKLMSVGLFPKSEKRVSLAEYVELDDWAKPIQVNHDGIKAVALLQSLLLSEPRQGDALSEQLVKALLEFAAHESEELRVALFRRSKEYAERNGSRLPAELYAFLPWHSFNQHLVQLISDLRKRPDDISPVAPILPDLGSVFRHVQPKLAPALRELTEWRSERLEWKAMCHFLSAVWFANLRLIPNDTRELLFNSVLFCGVFLRQESAIIKRNLPTRDRVTLAQAQVRSMLLLNRLRLVGGRVYLHRKLQNLEEALVIAADAGFLSTRVNFLEKQLLTEVKECESEIPVDASEFLLNVEEYFIDPRRRKKDRHVSDGTRFNHLLDAAELFKFAALISARLEDDQDAAIYLLQRSEPYYYKAATLDLPENTRARLYKRWARKVLLAAELAESKSAAIYEYNRALELLKKVTGPPNDDSDAGYGSALLRAYALFGIASVSDADESEAIGVKQAFKEAISQTDPEGTAITLLADYYVQVEKNPDAALKILDEWVAEQQAGAEGEQLARVNFIQFYTGEICAQAFEEMPSWGSQAVARFSLTLKDQPTNLIALERLLDVFQRLPEDFADEAREAISHNLTAPFQMGCPLTHAIAHILCEVPIEINIVVSESPAAAIATLTNGPPLSWETATETLLNATQVERLLSSALEITSKWFFRLGRSTGVATYLNIADRLLGVALIVDPLDVVWVSRKIDIAVALKKFDIAANLLNNAIATSQNDPILQLRAAQFELAAGQLDHAKDILERLVAQTTADQPSIHPAILDNLAIIALRQGSTEKAEMYYLEILEQRKFDARAEFGLGRIKFIKGTELWSEAFRHWRTALRFQAQSTEFFDRKHAWRTAHSIAGLFREAERGSSTRVKLLENLIDFLKGEDALINSILIDGLRQVAITDRDLLPIIMDAADRIPNARLRRRAAQFLMGFAINNVLKDINVDAEVRMAINWCKRHGILSEFLAGAKGSYARTLLNLEVKGQEVRTWLAGLVVREQNELRYDKRWSALKSHIGTMGYIPDYYSTATKLTSFVTDATDESLAASVRGLIVEVALRVYDNKILKNIVPTIALWRLSDVLNGSVSEPSELAGWVDRDLLDFAGHELGNGKTVWRFAETRVEREISRLPPKEMVRPFNDGGIFFARSMETEAGPNYLYINLLNDLPDLGERLAPTAN